MYPVCATSPTHLISLDMTILIIYGEEDIYVKNILCWNNIYTTQISIFFWDATHSHFNIIGLVVCTFNLVLLWLLHKED